MLLLQFAHRADGQQRLNLTAKKEKFAMKPLILIASIALLMAFGSANPAGAEEYYVVKSRSGVVRIVDHKPQGNATVMKGPFKTREEAEKALKPSVDPRSPNLNP
jgi:hypothetical protein